MERYAVGGSEEEARATLAAHHYRPIGPWPRLPSRPWHVLCLKCGAELWVKASVLRHRPVRTGCHHQADTLIRLPYAKRRLPGFRKLTAAEALDLNRYRLLDPEQKVGTSRIRVACALCGAKVYVSVAALRRDALSRGGKPRALCVHPSTHLRPIRQPTPARINGREEDLRVLAEHKYEPVGEWPRSPSGEWHARCLLCQAEVLVRVSVLRKNAPRSVCRHPLSKVVKPAPPRDPTEQVREMLAEHSYEPVGSCPSSPDSPWHLRCLLCEAEVWGVPRQLMTAAARKRCVHRTSKIIKPSAEARKRAAEHEEGDR